MESLNIKFRKLAVVMGLLLLITANAHSQDVLSAYVDEGLKGNIALKQKNITLEQARQSLDIARSYFLPTVNVLADYTSGKGGRSIDLPIGDLLNPVYGSLNQLTQSDKFPAIENVQENFFPKDFYDARLRTSLPLINTDLYINQKIQGQTLLLKEYEAEAYKRELVREIKSAYFNYLSAKDAVSIFESGLELMKRNVEVNESLVRNGKILPSNLLRSRSELEKVRAEHASAQAQVSNAQKHFNFLLNRDLNAEVAVDQRITDYYQDEPQSIEGREELQMMRSLQEIASSSMQFYQLSRLPKVNAFLDLGAQASEWQFNSGSRYYLFGVQLTLPIFQGFRQNMQIRQSRLNLEKSQLDYESTAKQLQVSADIAWNNLNTARQNVTAAKEQLTSARSYFNLVDKGYQQGVNSLIEFIDARNQLTSSELQLNLRHYDLLKAAAHYERETSSFNLPN